jgi:PAS domain S-box-containing protein
MNLDLEARRRDDRAASRGLERGSLARSDFVERVFERLTEGFFAAELVLDAGGTPVDLRFLDMNSACERLIGHTREAAIGHSVGELFNRVDPEWVNMPASAIASGTAHRRTVYVPEVRRWFDMLYFPIDGAVFGCLFLDVTLREATELARKEAELRLDLAQSVAQIGTWEYDPRTLMVTASPSANAIYGLPHTEAERPLSLYMDRVHPLDAKRLEEETQSAGEAASDIKIEYRLLRPDGTVRWIAARGDTVLRADGSQRMVGALFDITDRKLAEEELQRIVEVRTREAREALEQLHAAQKLEAIGQLTGGVAHDFNNLLMAILGSLAALDHRLGDDPKARRLLDNAVEAANRGAELTQRLLAFARRQELEASAIDVEALFAGLVGLVKRSVGPRVVVEIAVAEGTPGLRADRNALELAILNLAVNARDAMADGGRLTLSACGETVGEGGSGRLGLAPGDYVRISVRDTGTGMDAETMRRAAEPFFTTKGVGRGTGLGLSMVDGLARQSGGAMMLRSALGEGTVVELWLPATDAGPAAVADPVAATPPAPARHVVLVVEDDPLVAIGTTSLLEELGHVAIEAMSGAEALEILAGRSDVTLVITDQGMPGMTGTELARAIRARWPALPVVLATGYADVPDADPSFARLGKPFGTDELAAAIAAATAA